LFTTSVIRHPAAGGPYLRIENSIKALSQISELFLHCRTLLSAPELEYYQQICRGVTCDPAPDFQDRLARRLRGVINTFFIRILKKKVLPDPINYLNLLRAAEDLRPDIIWLGYGNISYPLVRYLKENTGYPVVCDTDSVWSRFLLRGLPFARTEADRKKIVQEGKAKEEEERWGTQLADMTTAVSETDAEYYRKLARSPHQVRIFSNVIDLSEYADTPRKPDNFRNPCICLTGTFWAGSPMEEAVRWMIRDVVPRIRERIPDLHFYILGRGSDTVLEDVRDSGITVTGEVPSVLPYLSSADAAVVPLRFESGTRFKILEAGACGVPVVSTTLGAEGIPITPGLDILIADDPETFADDVVQLLSNPGYAHQMGSRLNALVRENYDLGTLVAEGREIIDALLPGCGWE